MDWEKKLEKEENLTLKELDMIIQQIRQNYWPRLKDKKIPPNCFECELFKFCQRINERLICPWIQD